MAIIRITLFALLFAATYSVSQELPDAPVPGNPVPGNPVPRYKEVPTWKQFTGQDAKFFTFRKSWEYPPLRTNRQTFNRKFILLHVGAAAAMVAACRNPRSGEEWHSELPVPIALAGLDYVMSRFFTEATSVEAPVYVMAHYAKAATK